MAAGTVTARVHLLQIELSGSKIKLHGDCVRELEDTDGSKANVGNCAVEIEVTAAEVKALVDKVKAELARLAALPTAGAGAKQFAGLTVS